MKRKYYRTPAASRRPSRRTILYVLALLFIAGGSAGFALTHNDRQALAATSSSSVAPSVTTTRTTAVTAKTTTPPNSLATTLPKALAGIMSSADSDADVAVYDAKTGQTIHYTNAGGTYNTASIVKLSILEELLLQDQAKGEGITSDQLSYATPMIENSDNDAATELWDEVGEGPVMQQFFDQVGATGTSVNPQGHWGLTQTTALDQLKVLNQFAYPDSSLLNSTSVGTITSLLSNVEADQEWGVSGGVPSSATVLLKNGWLDDTNGWDINSIGHVSGDGVDYTVAVLSDQNDTEQGGIDTVEALSSAVYQALASAPTNKS